MSALLAHTKIVEGHEKHFEELSRELYQKSHEMEDCIIRYEYYIYYWYDLILRNF